jgi:hypothetical protein
MLVRRLLAHAAGTISKPPCFPLLYREEAQCYVVGKDEELAGKAAEAQALLRAATAQRGEIERLQHENGILKQGVRIQVCMHR